MTTTIKILVIGFIAGLGGTWVGYQYLIKPSLLQIQQAEPQFNAVNYESPVLKHSSESVNTNPVSAPVDFSEAAAKATPSVVFINSISEGVSISYWDWFFGEGGNGRQTQ